MGQAPFDVTINHVGCNVKQNDTGKLDMARVFGVDPGNKGALVLIDTVAATLACEPMPMVKVKRSDGGWKSEIDEGRMAEIVRAWLPIDCGWIEDVYSMPGEGHVGAFTFGEGKGKLKGVLAGCGVPRRKVHSSVWKRDLNVGDEGVLITARCDRLFPLCSNLLKSEGKREAAMITLWGVLHEGYTVASGLLTPLTPLRRERANK